MLLGDGESRGVIDSGESEQNGKGDGTGDSDGPGKDESGWAQRWRLEKTKGGAAVERSRCHGDAGRRRHAMGARYRNGHVGEEIEGEADASEDAGFVAETVVHKLQGFLAIAGAEASGVEAEKQGEDFLRHNPPERFFGCARCGGGRQGGRLRYGRVCGRRR